MGDPIGGVLRLGKGRGDRFAHDSRKVHRPGKARGLEEARVSAELGVDIRFGYQLGKAMCGSGHHHGAGEKGRHEEPRNGAFRGGWKLATVITGLQDFASHFIRHTGGSRTNFPPNLGGYRPQPVRMRRLQL